MTKYTKAVYKEFNNLVEDSQALLTATADAAKHEVVEARKRLTTTLERSKQAWAYMQAQARAGVAAADDAVQEHLYEAAGIALGLGVVLGWLLTRRK